MSSHATVLKGALLVAGTSVGGGMLALPVLTSPGGFVPSSLIFLACWLFMAATGLLFVEVALCLNRGVNIISMSQRTLGSTAKVISWFLYLGLFYCLSVAYIVGCGDLTAQVLTGYISNEIAPFLFVLIFAPLTLMGTRFISRLNVVLMVGLISTFLLFIATGYGFVDSHNLTHRNWLDSLLALPIAFTAFAYHGVIPTLVDYMNRDLPRIRKAILIGSAFTFTIYLIWQWLIQGIIPVEGAGGLAEALQKGQNAVDPLKNFIHVPAVYIVGNYFAFFALVTSFIGVALGLTDFLADGLGIKKTPGGKVQLCLLVFIPPVIIAYFYPGIFLSALDYAGGYGCALLLGLLPILMAWSARYRSPLLRPPRLVPGGKTVLLLLAAFVIFELLFELRLTLYRSL